MLSQYRRLVTHATLLELVGGARGMAADSISSAGGCCIQAELAVKENERERAYIAAQEAFHLQQCSN